jgi:hypothetical protein
MKITEAEHMSICRAKLFLTGLKNNFPHVAAHLPDTHELSEILLKIQYPYEHIHSLCSQIIKMIEVESQKSSDPIVVKAAADVATESLHNLIDLANSTIPSCWPN